MVIVSYLIDYGCYLTLSLQIHFPCSEKAYDAYVSSRYWPNDDIAEVLVQDVCNTKPQYCSTLKNKTSAQKRDNFLKLNIYYRDLNYEEINEEPDYDTYQVMSDFGGTIGLWLGFSMLSLFEILQIFVPLLLQVLGRRKGHAAEERENENESKL
ncbi:amiloride-sensitive sodium channel subunit gamma-like [Biomphalaria glabrata]|uniref:Amiloride-sensitive sodium channel subunit gamma-like n=1 Tax=Biomphalaria glabrata TaxID=6526 RepID=A0A9W3AEF4_BIOGL|nr:amiloride-sensitive sodium channel subunit gamma-like [Biomphalaria glabrata]